MKVIGYVETYVEMKRNKDICNNYIRVDKKLSGRESIYDRVPRQSHYKITHYCKLLSELKEKTILPELICKGNKKNCLIVQAYLANL